MNRFFFTLTNMAGKYKRVLLKLSGESLMGKKSFGIDPERLKHYAKEIDKVVQLGVEIAVVIGGGNIFRGLQASDSGIERVQGDYMGMLATVINGMALQSTLESQGVYSRPHLCSRNAGNSRTLYKEEDLFDTLKRGG